MLAMSSRVIVLGVVFLVASAVGAGMWWTRERGGREERADIALGPAATVHESSDGEPIEPDGRVALDTTPAEPLVTRATAAASTLEVASKAAGEFAVIAGRVVDESEGGVTGAKVRFERAEEEDGVGKPSVTTWTDDRSHFLHPALPAGSWALIVQAAGYEPQRVELGELHAGDQRVDLVVRLTRPPRVRGVVSWPGGAPAVRAEVDVFARESAPDKEEPRVSREGSKTTKESSTPVVRTRPGILGPSLPQRLERTSTDAHGAFATQMPKGTSFLVVARGKRLVSEAFAASLVSACGLDVGGREITCASSSSGTWPPSSELAIELAPRACIVGRVTDDQGVPLVGVRLTRRSRFDDLSRASSASVRTDAHGIFSIDDLPLAEVAIDVRPDKTHAPRRISIVLAEPITRRDVVLGRLSSIEGVVLDEHGKPLADAGVELVDAERAEHLEGLPAEDPVAGAPSVSTDAQGRFRFENVPPGKVRLTARDWLAYQIAPYERTLEAGTNMNDVVLRTAAGAAIRGRATLADETALEGAIVQGRRTGSGDAQRTAETDGDGEFLLGGLRPGTWTLRIDVPYEEGVTPSDLHAERTVELVAGVEVDVTLVAGP